MLVQLKRVSVDLSALYWNAMRDVEESESVAFTHINAGFRDIRHFVEQERAMSIDGFAARVGTLPSGSLPNRTRR